jgi:hypothetical protein
MLAPMQPAAYMMIPDGRKNKGGSDPLLTNLRVLRDDLEELGTHLHSVMSVTIIAMIPTYFISWTIAEMPATSYPNRNQHDISDHEAQLHDCHEVRFLHVYYVSRYAIETCRGHDARLPRP